MTEALTEGALSGRKWGPVGHGADGTASSAHVELCVAPALTAETKEVRVQGGYTSKPFLTQDIFSFWFQSSERFVQPRGWGRTSCSPGQLQLGGEHGTHDWCKTVSKTSLLLEGGRKEILSSVCIEKNASGTCDGSLLSVPPPPRICWSHSHGGSPGPRKRAPPPLLSTHHTAEGQQ